MSYFFNTEDMARKFVTGAFDELEQRIAGYQSLFSDTESITEKASGIAQEFVKKLDFKGLSKEFSSKVGTFTETFFENLNTEKTSSLAAGNINKAIENFLNKLDTGKFAAEAAKNINRASSSFAENLEIENAAHKLGEKYAESFDAFSEPVTNSLGRAVGNLTSSITWNTLPYIALASAVTIGTPLLVSYIYYSYKHAIGRPKLATEIKNVTILTPLYDRLGSIKDRIFKAQKPVDAIFNQEISSRMDDFASALINASKNKGFLPNLILHGPGGTGKTMIAKQIVKKSGMSYVAMSGGDLAQYIKRGEHVSELNKLMESAKKQKTILFIDEAESLTEDRDLMNTPERLELINAFLNHTGEESKNLSIILATNRIARIDEAVMSRMDYKIEVTLPGYPERAEILSAYIAKRFSKEEIETHFTEKTINRIAYDTEGFTGRALSKMIKAISNKIASTEKNELTTALIDETVREFIAQEKRYGKAKGHKSLIAHIFFSFFSR
ncbi:MAG: ATP-dependent zinc metalloprotease FtsH 3 [Chlamydiae bacterium]|nr:ATP-dependent zinc metalloprotease FtsH 3 [Chlamydiota bacterium]